MGYKLKRILIYPDGVTEKQVYPAGWKPNANTIAYYPLTSTSTVNDLSGNQNVLTNSGVSFGVYDGVDCAYFNGSSYLQSQVSAFTDINHTISVWFKMISGSRGAGIVCSNPCGIAKGEVLYPDGNQIVFDSYNGSSRTLRANATTTNWNYITFTGGNLYINGELKTSGSGSFGGGYTFCIGGHTAGSTCSRVFVTGYIGNVILENKVRTADEVLNYYNRSKSNYGL